MKNFLTFFFLSFFIFLLISGCTSSQNVQNVQKIQISCCEECLAQAERDPSGYDISIKPCRQYELSEECGNFFRKESVLVGECRNE
ncbi:hypothetical protein HYX13_01330 [Candidatus Woesearchaeota archaeon]|nr:hypothetical protein [Candidatus Woesearchaeota archaeon]